ncbi:MAG: TrmH family RNA methyltransferase [Chloroflexi bacterium]|jgi:RNA methyltransferase, TrmH family|nr:TrmH family RNA methyltransferase [Chloroflexota bacterium]
MILKRYKKNFAHSYTFGVFPTLELLTHRVQDVLGVWLHPRASQNSGVSKIEQLCQQNAIPIEIHEKNFNRLGARENDYAIGVLRKFSAPLDAAANHLVLVNPGSRGNLGTIIRAMLGFGFYDLAVIEPAADIFHPDVLRAAMGALFQLRFEHFADFNAYQNAHSQNIYVLMTDGVKPLNKVDFQTPFGLVFGNESSGLPPEFHAIGTSLRIPQSGAIDSLNLSIAVGVTLYQASLAQVD